MKATPGFNLYIDLCVACNAQCRFCIAPTHSRVESGGFWAGLDYGIRLTESVNGTLQVTGGEPTISSRFSRLMEVLHHHHFRRVVLNTNGSHLSDDIVTQILIGGVDHVNISRHHWRADVNKHIMGG